MILYLIVGVISATLMYIATNKAQRKGIKFLLILLSFLPFFSVLAFRYGIGYDYLNIYDKLFHSIIHGGSSNWEPGIIALVKWIGSFSHDSFYFFFATSLITSLFVYKGILKNSEKPWLSLLLFVVSGLYMDSMNAVRQYIAISIFMYAIKFILQKDFKRYLFWVIIASLFHSSALILIPIYFFCRWKMTWKKRLITAIALIAVLPVISTLTSSLIANTKYSFYLSGVYGKANPTYSELITSIVFFVIASIFYKRKKDDERYGIYYNLIFLFLIVAILSFKVLLAYRIIMYLKISVVMFIPTLLTAIKRKNRALCAIASVGFLGGVTVIGAYVFGWYDTEYVSIFEKWSK